MLMGQWSSFISDLERLPSGKFATNDLVLHSAILAYNLLRILGQESLKREDTPLKNGVQRRRIRAVIQNLMTLAAKMTGADAYGLASTVHGFPCSTACT